VGHPGARLALTTGQLGRSQSTLKERATGAKPTPPGTLPRPEGTNTRVSSNELIYGIASTFELLLVVAFFLAFARWVRVERRRDHHDTHL